MANSTVGCGIGKVQHALLPLQLIMFRNSSSRPNKPLWFSGHSLGGAMSSLFAAWTFNKGGSVWLRAATGLPGRQL